MKQQIIYKPFLNLIKIIIYGEIIKKKITCRHHLNNDVWHNSSLYRSVKVWNKLPNELISCKNVEQFQLKLKKFDLYKIFISKIHK